MKINYFKVIPVFLGELLKLAPIFIKYGKIIYNEVKDIYNKDRIKELDKEIIASLEGENTNV